MIIGRVLILIVGLISIIGSSFVEQALAEPIPKTVRYLATIQLPGEGGFADFLVVSPKNHRLYAGFASANKLVVIDTQKNAVITSVDDLKSVRSIALIPDKQLGFTSNNKENTVGVINLKTNKLLVKIPAGEGPDAIIYDAPAKVVYVADHKGQTATLINPFRRDVVATIPLGGTAEYAEAEPKSGVVYQNLESTSEVVVVDPITKTVIARYKTLPGTEPTGLALDAAHERLFTACANQKLLVLDMKDGHIIADLPIGAGVDFAAYDAKLRRIYTANGQSGTMTVIQQDDPNHYHVLENVVTHPKAHALALNPKTHRLYVTYSNKIDVYAAISH